MNKKDRENRSVHKNRSGVDTTWILAGILVVLLIVAAVVYIGKKTSGTGDSGASAAPAVGRQRRNDWAGERGAV